MLSFIRIDQKSSLNNYLVHFFFCNFVVCYLFSSFYPFFSYLFYLFQVLLFLWKIFQIKSSTFVLNECPQSTTVKSFISFAAIDFIYFIQYPFFTDVYLCGTSFQIINTKNKTGEMGEKGNNHEQTNDPFTNNLGFFFTLSM